MEIKGKILWVSNNPLMVTGYAKVTREVCSRLGKRGYQVFVVGDQYVGQPINMDGYTLFPRGDGQKDSLMNWIQQLQPDNIVFLEDTFTLANQGIHRINWAGIPSKLIIYHPQDGYGVPTTGIPVLQSADHLVAMAKFSNNVVKKELGIESDVIYHGFTPSIFKPVSEEQKKQLRQKFNLPEDAVVFCYIGRNSLRKLNQHLLHTMMKFMASHDNVYLLLHISNPNDPGLDLFDFVNRGVRSREDESMDKVINSDRIRFLSGAKSLTMGVSEQEMAEIYQASDVYISASSGEGFGMPLVEAMACGIPVIATNYTTTQELILDGPIPPRGFGVNPAAIWTSSFNVDHAIWDMDDALEKIEEIYNNKNLRMEMGLAGQRFVEENCIWDDLITQWEAVFEKAKKLHYNENRSIPIVKERLLFINPEKGKEKRLLYFMNNDVQVIDVTKPIFKKLVKDAEISHTPTLYNVKTRIKLTDQNVIEEMLIKYKEKGK